MHPAVNDSQKTVSPSVSPICIIPCKQCKQMEQ
jgi:hypothetical protein